MGLTIDEVLNTPAQATDPVDQVTQEIVTPTDIPVNTSTSTETVDVTGVQDATNKIIQSMRNEGLTYAQAYEKYNPKPQADKSGMQNTQKLQKAAVIADMIRLATEGVGAFAGANVQRRDSSQVQGALAQRLLQQYAEYDKNLKEWNAKGVDAAMKDVQLANKLYERNLAAAPKTRTTVQDNAWDRQKHEEDKSVQREGIQAANTRNRESINAANSRAAASNATRIQAANISKEGKTDDEKGLTTIVFGDNSGSAKISKGAAEQFYNAAYRVILNDPAFRTRKMNTTDQIDLIERDTSLEGQASKIKVYVDQYLHESPKAIELLKSHATEFNRAPAPAAAPQQPAFNPGWATGTAQPRGRVREPQSNTPAAQRGGRVR